MSFSLYLDTNTWVHRLDGRTKIVCLLELFSVALLFSHPWYLLTLMSFVLMGMGAAKGMRNLQTMWVLLVLLFVYSMVLWPIFVNGQTPLLTIGNWVVSVEGLTHGMGMGLRLDVLVLSGMLFLTTTPIEDLSKSLQRFGLPPAIGFAISLAFRWVPTLLGSTTIIMQAQRSRGMDLASGGLLHKIRRYPPLVVPLIGHMLRQTNLLAMALESKGFGPSQPRMAYHAFSFQRQDYVALLSSNTLLGVSIWLNMHGYGTINIAF
ncbi:MAG: energy-coupling factor transporter transmembrane protein EcfT [Nitrospirales bacterium]|nr:energy-coupling factor transporter transmembrane protein EcfT [Nitrospirales bacterium]